MPSESAIRSAIEAYFAAIRAGDVNAWLATYAEDAVAHDPVGAPPHVGHAGLRGFFEGINSAFDSIALHEESIFVAGNEAAVKWRGEGTGMNGKTVTFEGIDVFQINEDGKIQSVQAYWNPAAMMAELQG